MTHDNQPSEELILYQSEDGLVKVQLRAVDGTVWLSQREMAQLFNVSTDNIGLHLKNIYSEGELSEKATTEESSVVQKEGERLVNRPLTLYNLDAILAVGFRVRSPRGTQFRKWANTILKEYLLKGFVMDDERLKNPDGRPDYFDEMLERIRDIRASEKRFYQKVIIINLKSCIRSLLIKKAGIFFPRTMPFSLPTFTECLQSGAFLQCPRCKNIHIVS